MRFFRLCLSLSLLCLAAILILLYRPVLQGDSIPLPHHINPASPITQGKSGLPIPRFVSIKTNPANLRKGPGTDYKIIWVFTKKHLPVEIIAEFGNWRKIRDADGIEGWIFHRLLSSQRTALVSPWDQETNLTPLLKARAHSSHKIALLQPNVLLFISRCNGQWCLVKTSTLSGWIEQSRIWGVYTGEIFD